MVKEIVPSDDDVLLGRGSKHHLHPGNQRYHGTSATTAFDPTWITLSLTHVFCLVPLAFLELNRDRYMDTTSPIDKKAIIKEIVDHIVLKNGRFLKRVVYKDNTKQWIALSAVKVHLKTAHAIQYRMRKKKSENVLRTKMTPNALLKQQLAQGVVAPLKLLAPKVRLCSYGGCQRLALECSTMCYYCYCWFQSSASQQLLPAQCSGSLAALVSSSREKNDDDDCSKDLISDIVHQMSEWTRGFAPILSCSAADGDHWCQEKRTFAMGLWQQQQPGTELETFSAHDSGMEAAVSREPWLDALLAKENAVDRTVSLPRTNSFVSLDVQELSSDLSMVPRDIDDSASVDTTISGVMNGNIDSDWLGSSLSLDDVDGYGGLELPVRI
jgi:hypothetical protein